MKKIINRIGFETAFGGLFGIVAIIAIVVQMIMDGMTSSAVLSGVKDIASTIVIVMVFIVGIKNVVKNYPKNFNDKLTAAIDKWVEENSNMIVRNPEHDTIHRGQEATRFSLDLKTEVKDFYNSVGITKNTGLFLRMPMLKEENYAESEISLNFYLNKGTFFSNRSKDADLTADYQQLIEMFCGLVNKKYSGFVDAAGKQQMITVNITKPIKTNDDIDDLIDVINTMYTAYLVSANLNK